MVVLLKMSDSVIFSLTDIFKTTSSVRKYLKIYRPLPTLIFCVFENFDSKTIPAKVIFFRQISKELNLTRLNLTLQTC